MLSDAVAFRLLPTSSRCSPALRGQVPAAVVSNWDCSLRRTLTRLGLELDAIVTCGETGVRKPDPRIFLEALGRLGVAPDVRFTSATPPIPMRRGRGRPASTCASSIAPANPAARIRSHR